MGSHIRKETVRELLRRRDWAALIQLSHVERGLLRTLVSFTFDPDELVRFRAVEAIGVASGALAESNEEKVRDFIRRQLWLMNDESGGLSPLAPDIIGEVLVRVSGLVDEFGPLLISYLRESPFERGTHAAIVRLSERRPDLFVSAVGDLRQSLHDSDPAVRGLAVRALSMIDPIGSAPLFDAMKDDPSEVEWYDFDRGDLIRTTLADFIGGARQGSNPTASPVHPNTRQQI
ncbi:MAG: DVU0298 family protein [Candidatus Zixiibacteriota bacterium]